MSTVNEIQRQINDLQLQINQIEAEIMTGKCAIACPRAQQSMLMQEQQKLMQLQASILSAPPSGGAQIENKSVPALTGINRPPPPIPGSETQTNKANVPASEADKATPASCNCYNSTSKKSLGLSLSNQIDPICAFTKEINAASQATKVPADLIGAVIYKESQGNPALISGKPTPAHRSAGIALGLMQVEPNTSPEIESKHPEIHQLDGAAYDIMLGAWRLADLAKQFQGWDLVLRAYNSGAWAPVLTDPSASITTGDPKYVYLCNAWWERLSTGRELPPSMNPDV